MDSASADIAVRGMVASSLHFSARPRVAFPATRSPLRRLFFGSMCSPATPLLLLSLGVHTTISESANGGRLPRDAPARNTSRISPKSDTLLRRYRKTRPVKILDLLKGRRNCLRTETEKQEIRIHLPAFRIVCHCIRGRSKVHSDFSRTPALFFRLNRDSNRNLTVRTQRVINRPVFAPYSIFRLSTAFSCLRYPLPASVVTFAPRAAGLLHSEIYSATQPDNHEPIRNSQLYSRKQNIHR